ncbi:hypothetical protein EW026_g663 [Hermanssonia centrifuga]|uniref:PCI domain-containing protein n=1 Tax=Hermanssonia centrifuga TaxID=98765 RepID=A0A4S4KUY8_9APHY|nr:hypothetical protein EW026_g663 [Hermanssonia centrifuga]
MSVPDAISVFAEGTFEEQIKELVNYLSHGRSDEEKAALIQSFETLLLPQEGHKPIDEDEERRKKVVTMVVDQTQGLGDGTEREIEGYFNLLFAHILSAFSSDAPETKDHLNTLLQTITSSPESSSIKYRILSNLFNAIPRSSSLRLKVNKTLVEIASENDELNHLHLSVSEVEKWLSEWQVTSEEKTAYLKTLVDVFAQAGDLGASYRFKLAYVRSLPSSEVESAALDVIATALRQQNVFDFDPIYRLEAVTSVKDSELYSLLHIFLNDGLSEYKAWIGSHKEILAKNDLDEAQLERKIRLLSLTTLAFQNVGRDLPYSAIAVVLQVEPSEVERWVIDVIRVGLVVGKLSQTAQTLHVVRALLGPSNMSNGRLLKSGWLHGKRDWRVFWR